MPPTERPFAEWVCLALVDEAPTHGWALARTLAPDGDVGRIWSLSRPLTYRAIDRLLADGLVIASGVVQGRGPARTMLRTSPAGRRAIRSWLKRPVAHLRDVRTVLLCKLILAERRNASAHALLEAQRRAFAPAFDALARRARARDADVVDRWRNESSQAVRTFLDRESRRQ